MSEPRLFKDNFDKALVEDLAHRIRAVHPSFPAQALVDQVVAELPPLELKQRVAVITRALAACLPDSYPEALAILLAALDAPGSNAEAGPASGWTALPLVTFVEFYGLDHFEESMDAMRRLTERFSAEFAIRPFLERYQDRALDLLRAWARDDNPHVRRLVSEGTRPRLPWAGRLRAFMADPAPVLELLEQLKDDPSPYVRTSVANNLNDIAKDHPDRVIATAARWSFDASEERRWIIRQALRTLVKQGHPDALALLGANAPLVRLTAFDVAPREVAIGDSLTITVALESTASAAQFLIVDYVVHYAGANGKARQKTFKLRSQTVAPGEEMRLVKRHSLKPVTVRRYYPGRHRVEIQVNGVTLGGVDFVVIDG